MDTFLRCSGTTNERTNDDDERNEERQSTPALSTSSSVRRGHREREREKKKTKERERERAKRRGKARAFSYGLLGEVNDHEITNLLKYPHLYSDFYRNIFYEIIFLIAS